MIYAVFSDIHSNFEALSIAIGYVSDLGITNILGCGDLTGYGPDPTACLSLLRKHHFISAGGNHDKAMIDEAQNIFFNDDASQALNYQKKLLHPNDLAYLRALPNQIQRPEFVVTHSSLDSKTPYRYIIDEASARDSLKHTHKKIMFIGHSHVPRVFVISENHFEAISAKEGLDMDLDMNSSYQYIVNVGSIGQPRDGNPQLSFCLYDSVCGIIRIVRLSYAVEKTQHKLKELGFPDFLIFRLSYGI